MKVLPARQGSFRHPSSARLPRLSFITAACGHLFWLRGTQFPGLLDSAGSLTLRRSPETRTERSSSDLFAIHRRFTLLSFWEVFVPFLHYFFLPPFLRADWHPEGLHLLERFDSSGFPLRTASIPFRPVPPVPLIWYARRVSRKYGRSVSIQFGMPSN